jgi:hypothetical protein
MEVKVKWESGGGKVSIWPSPLGDKCIHRCETNNDYNCPFHSTGGHFPRPNALENSGPQARQLARPRRCQKPSFLLSFCCNRRRVPQCTALPVEPEFVMMVWWLASDFYSVANL